MLALIIFPRHCIFFFLQALKDVEGFDGNKDDVTTKPELEKVLDDAKVSTLSRFFSAILAKVNLVVLY